MRLWNSCFSSRSKLFPCIAAMLLLLASLVLSSTAFAQVGANLTGVVKDKSGAVVPHASVKVTNKLTGLTQTLPTGDAGDFHVFNLAPATYDVEVSAAGFGDATKQIELVVGTDQALTIELGAAGTNEVVTVAAGGDNSISITSSQPQAVIDNTQLAVLPVLNRNFLAVAQTMPGAAPVAAESVYTKWATTKFGGPADQRNAYTTIIDGASIDDSTFGSPVINIGQDAIQEFKVYQHQFDAQYGRAMDAVINVVTLSGGDHYHGTGYYFGRNASLNAINAEATVKPPYNLQREGGTIGGPVPKLSATHFFGSFEYLNINTAVTEALPATNMYAPYENGNYPYTQWERLGDVKVDHNFTSTHSIFARYAYDHEVIPNWGPAEAAATTTDNSIAHSLVFEDNYAISPRMLNTARYEYLNHNLFTVPANYNVEIITPDFSFGQGPTVPQNFPRTNNGISDTVFLSTSKHQWKFGAALTKVYSTYQSNNYVDGSFNFTADIPIQDIPYALDHPPASLPATTAVLPQSFTQESPGNDQIRQLDWGFFVQDDWKVAPNLLLNLGFRYDFTSNMRDNKFYTALLANSAFAGISTFISPNRGTNFSGGLQPRFGFVYDVNGNGKIVIRGGAGLYETRMRPYWDLQAEAQTQGAAARITNTAQLAKYPSIPGVLNGETLQQYVASGGARTATVVDNNFALPYSVNFSGGFGWQINPQTSLNVDVVHDKSDREVGEHDLNLPAAPAIIATSNATLYPATPRPVATFGQFGDIFNAGSARYDALEMQLKSRPRKYFETVQVSYAYSRSIMNDVPYYSTYAGTQRTPQNYSRNPTDTPQNLSVAFDTKTLPLGFHYSSIFRGLSGNLFATSAGIDLDGDSNTTGDNPRGLPQYVGRGDIQGQLAIINAFRANPCGFIYYNGVVCTAKAILPTATNGTITASQLKPDPTLTWDNRLTRPVRLGEHAHLDLFFEAFNTTNHVTRYAPATTMVSTSYMIRTTALDPRQFQWGARITY
jgi:hypothetical protein